MNQAYRAILTVCFVSSVLQPEWQLVDPMCTLLGSVIVLAGTVGVLFDSVLVLLESKSLYFVIFFKCF